jgi:hypothetical protein
MERAIESAELDWRAITVEVLAGELATALAGMTAMNFAAARFFTSLQLPAAELMGAKYDSVRFIGGVTSAARTADGWQPWHHAGPVVLEWAASQCHLPAGLCWLHGDSLRTRSVLVALHERAAHESDELPAAIVWTNAPADLRAEWLTIVRDQAELRIATQVVGLADQTSPVLEQIERAGKEEGLEYLLLVADAWPLSEDELAAVGPFKWLLAGGRELMDATAATTIETVAVLNEVDQLIAGEAYDFRRWTGQSIPASVLRDAYDEYNDF